MPRAPYVTACNRQRAFSIEELDVFQCLSNDMTIEEEADHLDISASTVKARLKTARDRYGVKTNTWLVANALRANLIS
ncbi:helix-turn-helix domain-containing protein [Roseovarius aestuarii]|uniref:LuxR C-terminal-related transcriptional regulator n=1 Tax=Roseovarius aestuarii TaxID=475083 RepID=UPI000A26C553|nr:LuxR C-terminal-related transcriptional regulator [Roseovarius aestuarii]